ncbi:hypothetical protein WJX84_007336, partial [Apatococcus fuscideae]
RCQRGQWRAAVATFLDNLVTIGTGQGQSASRARSRASAIPSHVQVSLMASDIASVLERFASGLSFSDQSQGGGKESNSYLAPYLVQLGRHLANSCSAHDQQALQQVAVALGEPLPGDWRALAATATVQKLPYVLAHAETPWAGVGIPNGPQA